MNRRTLTGAFVRVFRGLSGAMKEIYNTNDELAKGRLVSLGSALMTALYNVFITGIFYTGFLTMYDISITGVGIISFIPLLASAFSIFSSNVLSRFRSRKKATLIAKIYFYAMYIIATNVMPVFVTDPDARLLWFGIILFLAYGVYALFSPALTIWFAAYYPADSNRRSKYIQYNQVLSSLMASFMMIISSLITDALQGESQHTLILVMRYAAFALVLVDVWIQAQAKDVSETREQKVSLRDVFVLPFRYKKFLRCMILMFIWNFLSQLNAGMWNFHLLNHINLSYTTINLMAVLGTILLILTIGSWRRLLRRYSWIKTFGIAILAWAPTEIGAFLMTPENAWWLYWVYGSVQLILTAGINLAYGNVLYMNMPRENATAHIAFQMVGCNLMAFFGTIVGTAIAGISGDETMMFLGIPTYSMLFTCLMRTVFMLILGLVCFCRWRDFTNDADIEEVEIQDQINKTHREMKKKMRRIRRLV